jgi:acetylornithine deacetylase/succinyl-diaminopimelate desuccinylase-like protein
MTVVKARGAIAEVLPSVRADLEALVRIPGVSADPAAGDAMRRAPRPSQALLEGAGLTEVEILQVAGGQPAVVGHRRIGDGVPTVLLYAHHDVQPAGPRADWDSDPYEPVERDGRLYGRGSADDKAGIALHLAVLRAYGDDLPVNVTVLVEGEEEIGSPTLAAFLAAYQDRLAADVIVLADSTNWQVGRTRAHHVAARRGQRDRRGPHAAPRRAQRDVRGSGPGRAHDAVPAARDPARRRRHRGDRGPHARRRRPARPHRGAAACRRRRRRRRTADRSGLPDVAAVGAARRCRSSRSTRRRSTTPP